MVEYKYKLNLNLKNKNLIDQPLILTLDSNIQHIINTELNEAVKTFNASGGGALLLDVNSGDIISLVSLPNFNINQRTSIKDEKYINKINEDSTFRWFRFFRTIFSKYLFKKK